MRGEVARSQAAPIRSSGAFIIMGQNQWPEGSQAANPETVQPAVGLGATKEAELEKMLRALRVPAIVGVGVPLLSGFRDASCEGRGAQKGANKDDPLGASKVLRESFRPPETGAFVSGRLKVEHHLRPINIVQEWLSLVPPPGDAIPTVVRAKRGMLPGREDDVGVVPGSIVIAEVISSPRRASMPSRSSTARGQSVQFSSVQSS